MRKGYSPILIAILVSMTLTLVPASQVSALGTPNPPGTTSAFDSDFDGTVDFRVRFIDTDMNGQTDRIHIDCDKDNMIDPGEPVVDNVVGYTASGPFASGIRIEIDEDAGGNVIRNEFRILDKNSDGDTSDPNEKVNPYALTITPAVINPPGQNVKIELQAVDETVKVKETTIQTPSGGSFPDDTPIDIEIVPLDLRSWETDLDFPGLSTSEIGTYILEIDIQIDAEEETILATIESSFFVIPESPIGPIALLGSSLGALGAFMFLRKSWAKPQF